MASKLTRRRTCSGAAAVAVILVASSLLAGAGAGIRSQPGDLEKVRRLVAELGPRGALDRLAADSVAFYAFLGGVAEARGEWLDVAGQLVSDSDGYAKESLVGAFSAALERKPEEVLVRGASGIPLSAVCAYDPLITISSSRTRKQFLAALEPRERAVTDVKRSDLAAAKRACLAALDHLKANVPAHYTP